MKSDPIGTVCGWKIVKSFVLRFPPFVFPRMCVWSIQHHQTGALCILSKLLFIHFLLQLLFQGLSYLIAEQIKAVLNWKVCNHQVDLYSQLYYFNFSAWLLPLAWQPSSIWMFCSGKLLKRGRKNWPLILNMNHEELSQSFLFLISCGQSVSDIAGGKPIWSVLLFQNKCFFIW